MQQNHKPRKADPNIHPSDAEAKTKKKKSHIATSRGNQLPPPEKEKRCHPLSSSISECIVASIAVSESEVDASPQAVEVQISTPVPDNKSEMESCGEEGAPGNTTGAAKRGRSSSQKTENGTGSGTSAKTGAISSGI